MSTKRTPTSRYDVAEHLRTPEEIAAYLEASLEEADGDAAFVAKALGDIAQARGILEEGHELVVGDLAPLVSKASPESHRSATVGRA